MFLSFLSVRKKAVLITVILLVLVAGGVFGYLFKTGKLGIGADTASQQITLKYSGKAIDENGNALAGATFFVADSSFETIAKTTTDNKGNYFISIPIQRPTADISYYSALKKDGYENLTRVSNQIISKNSNATVSTNQTHNLFNSPVGLPDNPCGNDEKIESSGLTICINESFRSTWNRMESDNTFPNLPNFSQLITIIQTEITRLRALTNLPNTAKVVYLYKLIPNLSNSNSAPPAHANIKNSAIELGAMIAAFGDEHGIRNVIDHEFGHFVDVEKGKSTTIDTLFADNRDIFNLVCVKSPEQPTIYKCPASLTLDFRATYMSLAYQTINDQIIAGYGAADEMEMFAEIFAELVDPNQADQEKLRYYLANYILDDPLKLKIGTQTEIKHKTIEKIFEKDKEIFFGGGQNVLMYAYDFILQKSLNQSYFPVKLYEEYGIGLDQKTIQGKISGNFPNNYSSDIVNARYTDKSVISFVLVDHNNRKMENTKFSIGSAGETTRLKKDTGVFSDGSGDLFDTTGTAVLMPGPTGEQTLNVIPPSYYPIPFAGQTVNLKSGANYVEAKYNLFSVDYRVKGVVSPKEARLRGIFESNNGKAKVTGLLKGSIPRYPDEGYDSPVPANGGYGVYDSLQKTDPILNLYNYKLEYIIGGGGDELYPIKETLFGPSGSLIPLRPHPPTFPGMTEFLLKEGAGNIVNGFFGQKCFDTGNLEKCTPIKPPNVGWATPSLP